MFVFVAESPRIYSWEDVTPEAIANPLDVIFNSRYLLLQ
jgi:hypothetical protein